MSFTKTMAAGALTLSALAMIGCGSNSGSPNKFPGPVVAHPVVARGVAYQGGVAGGGYYEEGYAEGGGPRGPGAGQQEDEGAACSVQNIDAALEQCNFQSEQAARATKQILLRQASQDGLVSPEVFGQLRLQRDQLSCLQEVLCSDQQSEEEAPRREVRRRRTSPVQVPESTDVPDEKPVLRKKF